MLVDGGLAAVLAFLGVAAAAVMVFHPAAPVSTPAPGVRVLGSPAEALTRAAAIPLALLLAVPVIFRRAHPVGAFAAGVVIGGIQVLLNVRPTATDLVIVILLYTLAAYTPRRTSVVGLAVCLGGSAVGGGPGGAGPPPRGEARAGGRGSVPRAPLLAGG